MNPITADDWNGRWIAPAKLNLFLHVTGRRSDGYHRLQTVFHFIDYGDTLSFRPRSDSRIVLAAPLPGTPPEQDLTVRAARLLQQKTGCTQGAEIAVDKKLPLGGGLGGGSSDAATTLLALNRLWRLGLSRATLQALGLELGADVPVFIFGRNSFADGIGEVFHPVDLADVYYVLIEPPLHVSTALIFADSGLCRSTPSIDPADWQPGPADHNDLEPVAVKHFPIIGEALTALAAYAPARMTGSGACVFAGFATAAAARQCAQALAPHWHCHVVAGLSKHPHCDDN